MTQPDTTRNVSNSEISSWVTCRQKYYYEYVLNVAPKVRSDSLSFGIMMHDVIAEYYRAIKDGRPDPRGAMEDELQKFMTIDAITSLKVMKALYGYIEYWATEDRHWNFIAIEEKYDIPLTNSFSFVMRLDILAFDTRTNEYWIWDHKSTYDFWKEEDFTLNMQFPKYIGALRNNGIDVKGVIVNQIRTRELKNPSPDDLYRRVPVRYPIESVAQAMKQQIVASEEVISYRNDTPARQKLRAVRIGNKMVCRGCGVRPLCETEFRGGSIDYLMQTDFTTNTYNEGYNPSAPNNSVEEW